MGDMLFADGTKQELYFPEGHQLAGWFKSVEILLQEREIDTCGIVDTKSKRTVLLLGEHDRCTSR
jgi:hypothetical protein